MNRSSPAEISCTPGCGACCIAPSITSPIPGMPLGKPASVRCVQLDEGNLCRLFDDLARPRVCRELRAEPEMCGSGPFAALEWLCQLERITSPEREA